jgi:hypothetical protein
VLQLRAVAIQQVHGTALVNWLRAGRITGTARDNALRLFHGVSDLRDATLAEHRGYLVAASTQVCTRDLLDLVGDAEGLDMLRRYELAYSQYFAMFCERALALQRGKSYLLGSLLPEVKDVADRLRLTIIGSKIRPAAPRSRVAGAAQSASTARASAPRFERRAVSSPAGPRERRRAPR